MRTTKEVRCQECLENHNPLLCSCVQVLEEENQNLSGQVALLEDQLKMASVASSRKLADVLQRHRELGLKLKDMLKLHENMESHLVT